MLHVIRYQKDIIFPYQPRQIVIYCGENDIANDSTITGKAVFKRFKKLYKNIRKDLPHVFIVYISMKPSPSRWSLKNKMLWVNKRINKFLVVHTGLGHINHFINVWDAMLGADGKPLPQIFIEDHLHMNAKGYAIWQKIIEPVLIK